MKSLLKKILNLFGGDSFSDRLYKGFFNLKESIQYKITYPLLLNIPFLQSIYFIASRSFNYEKSMFVAARKDYLSKKQSGTKNLFLLRRNIHRIEKGLLMKNRRAIFALDYIVETTTLLKNIYNSTSANEQLQWAHDILEKYFKVTSSHATIKKAKQIFNSIEFKNDTSTSYSPYQIEDHKSVDNSNLYDSFKKLATRRKSVRYFDTSRVPERTYLDKAVEIAGLAPSSCNRQPFIFRIIDDPELAKKAANLAGGTTGFADHIPAIVAVVGQMNVSPTITDRHLMYIDGSLASMNFMLALESMQIGSCPLNWPEDKAKDTKMAKLLSLEKYERPIMLIAYGFAEEKSMLACSVRKPLDQLRQYN